MVAEQTKDELVFAGRATLCEYIETSRYKVIRFSGSVLIRDWEFVRELYGFLKTVEGTCLLDLSEMPEFDSTLYTIFIWMRILAASRKVRFLVVAGDEVGARLKAAGIGKWTPIIPDISVFLRALANLTERDDASAPSPMPPAAVRVDAGYSSRSAA